MKNNNLPDVQKSAEGFHKIYINKVGVRNIEIPIKILNKEQSMNDEQNYFHSVANISSYCDLVNDVKGINMSRIARTIYDHFKSDYKRILNLKSIRLLSESLKFNHKSNNVFLKIAFKYIFNSNSPQADIATHEPVDCIFEDEIVDGVHKTFLTIEYTGMSLCPCSKEMSLLFNNVNIKEKEWIENNKFNMPDDLYEKLKNSGFGAHNQKSVISIKVELMENNDVDKIMWIEDLVNIANHSFSCNVWSALKREDEKYVTEASYMGKYINDDKKFVDTDNNDGPKFVEDIARDAAYQLNKHLNIKINDYVVVVNNQESIHSNNVLATAVLNAGLNLK